MKSEHFISICIGFARLKKYIYLKSWEENQGVFIKKALGKRLYYPCLSLNSDAHQRFHLHHRRQSHQQRHQQRHQRSHQQRHQRSHQQRHQRSHQRKPLNQTLLAPWLVQTLPASMNTVSLDMAVHRLPPSTITANSSWLKCVRVQFVSPTQYPVMLLFTVVRLHSGLHRQ